MRARIENWISTKRYTWNRYDLSMIAVVIILCVISIYTLSLMSKSEIHSGNSDFRHQLLGVGIGFVAMLVCSIIDYHTLCTYVPILYIISILMAAGTRFSPLGTDNNTGSYRWLDFIVVRFQPSEICKIILILTLAVFFTKSLEHLKRFRTIFLAFLIAVVPTFFILIQSDLSSGLVLLFVMAMMIIGSGIGWKIITPIVGVLTPLTVLFFWYIQQPGQRLLKDYQVDRILGFLNPESEKLGVMYQQNNALVSIASGRLYGKQLLEGATDVSRNYNKVDVAESDFIWSVIGEEYGFIGSIAILALLSFIIIKCFMAAIHARDYTGMMIAIGISALLSFQIFFNIGVATRILPNTGLPLPFLSAGLSSMMSSMMAVGIIINIRIQPARAGTSSITFMEVDKS